ncbi:hypothetical protein U9R90_26565 [Streptomyces sp. E11-3]|uniref:hypothetical protein n=1 Tax=Streptomyces sp. E11-3 TaxID=3110112 RepID=UPI00397EBD76
MNVSVGSQFGTSALYRFVDGRESIYVCSEQDSFEGAVADVCRVAPGLSLQQAAHVVRRGRFPVLEERL